MRVVVVGVVVVADVVVLPYGSMADVGFFRCAKQEGVSLINNTSANGELRWEPSVTRFPPKFTATRLLVLVGERPSAVSFARGLSPSNTSNRGASHSDDVL